MHYKGAIPIPGEGMPCLPRNGSLKSKPLHETSFFDRVEVTGQARYPSHTTGRAVFRIRRLDSTALPLWWCQRMALADNTRHNFLVRRRRFTLSFLSDIHEDPPHYHRLVASFTSLRKHRMEQANETMAA